MSEPAEPIEVLVSPSGPPAENEAAIPLAFLILYVVAIVAGAVLALGVG